MSGKNNQTSEKTEQEYDAEATIGNVSRRSVLSTIGTGAAGMALGTAGTAGTAAASSVEDSPAAGFASNVTADAKAVRSGWWSDSSTWDIKPRDGDNVIIEKGVTVTIDPATLETVRIKTLIVKGTLKFATDSDTHLRAETIVTLPDSTLKIGTEDNPIRPDTEAKITFVHHEDISEKDHDPERISKGLITMGELKIHGAEKTSWTDLDTVPTAGTRKLKLSTEPTNWQPGDEIVVPGLQPLPANQDEERTIKRVSGSTVVIDEPLEYDHTPPENNLDADLTAYVLNLSRNVVLESEVKETDPEKERRINRQGHVMLMKPSQTVENFRLIHVGRTNKRYKITNQRFNGEPTSEPIPDEPNPQARYSFHFHRTGLGEDPHEVSGVVAQNSPGWGIVNHYAHANVSDSITYQVFGAGFVAESGPERGSFKRCFALRSRGSPKNGVLPARSDGSPVLGFEEFGHEGNGFWFQGPGVATDDCVAAGHAGYAYAIWGGPLYNHPKFGDEHPGFTGNYPAELAVEDGMVAEGTDPNGMFNSRKLRLKSFTNNTAFASGGGFDYAHFDGFTGSLDEPETFSIIDNFVVYNIGAFIDENGNELHPRPNGNMFGEGGKCAIAQRYADGLLVRNPQFCNTGTGGGHGVRRNFYPRSGAVMGGIIEGFGTGIYTTDMSGPEFIEGVTFLDNGTDIAIPPAGDSGGQEIRMADNEHSQGEVELHYSQNHTLVHSLFDDDSKPYLDGRRVYYDQQDPSYVPFNSPSDIDKLHDPNNSLGNNDRFFGVPMSEAKDRAPGMTNKELAEEFGMNILGTLTPDNAVEVPVINGGKVEPIYQSVSEIIATQEVTFIGDMYRDGASYEWDLGDGTMASGPEVTHTYEEGGEYEVELTVTRADGTTNTYSTAVTVNPMQPALNPGPVKNGINFEVNDQKFREEPGPGVTDRIDLEPVNNDPYFEDITYDGYVKVPERDVYKCTVRANEKATLYIDEEKVVTNGQKKVGLDAGFHKLRVEYTEYSGEQHLEIRMDGPGMSGEIPANALYVKDESATPEQTPTPTPTPEQTPTPTPTPEQTPTPTPTPKPGVDYRPADDPGPVTNGIRFEVNDHKFRAEPGPGVTDQIDLDPVSNDPYFEDISYEGYVKVPEKGTYTFTVRANHKATLFIGDDKLVTNGSKEIGLQAGFHEIRVEYTEYNADQHLEIRMDGPGMSGEIPAEALYVKTDEQNTTDYRSADDPGPVTNGVRFEVNDHKFRAEPGPGVTDQIDLDPVSNDPYYEDISYEGYVQVPEKGTYTFTVRANHEATLFIGDDKLVTNGSKELGLQAGFHEIRVEYTEYNADQHLEIRMDGPGMSGEIPAEALYVKADEQNTTDYRPADDPGPVTNGIRFEVNDHKFRTEPGPGITDQINLAPVSYDPYYEDITYTGYVEAPKKGIYKFTVSADHEATLYIDDEKIVTNGSKEIGLKAGFHKIRVKYTEYNADQHLEIQMDGPGMSGEIPADALYTTEYNEPVNPGPVSNTPSFAEMDYDGYLKAPQTGVYEVTVDGTLYIDGENLIKDGTANIGLKAGFHTIRLEHDGTPEIKISGPGMSGEIPSKALYARKHRSAVNPGPVKQGINFEVSDHKFRAEPGPGVTDQIDLDPVSNDPYYEDITYDGYVKVPNDGTYEMTVKANHTATLYIGADKLVTDGREKISLQAGFHKIRVEYTEYNADQHLEIRMDGPGMSGEIPAEALYVATTDGSVNGSKNTPNEEYSADTGQGKTKDATLRLLSVFTPASQ